MRSPPLRRGKRAILLEDFDGSVGVCFPKSFALMERTRSPTHRGDSRQGLLREDTPKVFADEAILMEEVSSRRARGIQISLSGETDRKTLESRARR